MPMEQDTSSKSASKELSPALLKATVVHLAKANKAISLSDIIKYLTKEKGMAKITIPHHACQNLVKISMIVFLIQPLQPLLPA